MISVAYSNSEQFVEKLQRKGVDVSWNGWNMVFFNSDKRALRSPEGVRKGTRWGYETVVSPNLDGHWVISPSLTRGTDARR